MRKILLVSHGTLAQGMHSFVNVILRNVENIHYINAYVSDTDFEQEASEFIALNQGNDVVIITDLFGGSVNNFFIDKLNSVHLVAGMNPLLVLNLAIKLNEVDNLQELIGEAVRDAKEGIVYCNHISFNEETEEEF